MLTDHFVSHFAAVYGKEVEKISSEAYRLLRRYSWPGNVRELKNIIQTGVLMLDGNEFTAELLPQRIKDAVSGGADRAEPTGSFHVGATLEAVERELIRMTLDHIGNKQLAAKTLGISRRALYNKIKKHKLA